MKRFLRGGGGLTAIAHAQHAIDRAEQGQLVGEADGLGIDPEPEWGDP